MRFHPDATTTAPAAEMFDRLEPRLLLTTLGLQPFPDTAPDVLLEFQLDAPAVAVIGVGDINADGRGDFAVTLAGADDIPREVRLFSGADASLLRTLTDDFAGFGAALAAPGDLTGDGVPDLLVSSPRAHDGIDTPVEGGRGLVYLFSGADGTLVRTFAAPGDDAAGGLPDEFGFALAVIADLNSDGLPDIIVGAPGEGDGDRGEVYILSGADGTLLRTFTGENPGDRFGHAVASAGDFALPDHPADGVPDILIGAPRHDTEGLEDAGKAYLFSGATGELLTAFTDPSADSEGNSTGPQAGAHFGHALAANDESIIIGAPLYDNHPPTSLDGGRAVHIRTDGSQSATIGYQAGTHLGERITPLGDLTRRGGINIGITQPGYFAETGGTTIVDGFPISGVITAAAGDIDGDNFDDVISFLPGVGGENGTVRIYSTFHFRPRGSAAGASPDFSHIWFNDGGFLLSGGEYTPYADIPGLRHDDRITDINTRGDILGYGRGEMSRIFILSDGDRTEIPAAITEVVGGELGQTGLRGVRLLSGGEAILAVSYSSVWRFDDGVLTFLWYGLVNDSTPSGTAVGSGIAGTFTRPPTYILTPDGELAVIPNFTGLAIAESGVVAGFAPGSSSTDPGQLALWIDGEITRLGGPGELPGGASEVHWLSADVTDDGNIIAKLSGRVPSGRGTAFFFSTYYYSPQTGLFQGEPAFSGDVATTPIDWYQPVFSASGIYTPIEDRNFRPAPGSPIIPVINGDTITAVARNHFGSLILFRSSTNSWGRIDLASATGSDTFRLSNDQLFSAFFDPIGGDLLMIITGPDGTLLVSPLPGGSVRNLSTSLAASPITANLTVFTSADGRAHILGTDANGDWIGYYQTGDIVNPPTTDPGGPLFAPIPEWRAANISTDLAAQGLSLPTLTGTSAFVTPWNTFHIVGLDHGGAVHALWWAPSLPGWRFDNLSAAAGAAGFPTPALTGNLAAFMTSWNTIHIAGTTAPVEGTPGEFGAELSVLWWAPEFGGAWRTDILSTPDGAPSLQPGSLTAYTSPWGGLSIAGISTSIAGPPEPDELLVFWWSPATPTPDNPSGWNLTSLHDAATTPTSPTPPSIAGPLASTVTPTGHQHLFAISADITAFLNFQWSPGDGPTWTLTDLTASAQ